LKDRAWISLLLPFRTSTGPFFFTMPPKTKKNDKAEQARLKKVAADKTEWAEAQAALQKAGRAGAAGGTTTRAGKRKDEEDGTGAAPTTTEKGGAPKIPRKGTKSAAAPTAAATSTAKAIAEMGEDSESESDRDSIATDEGGEIEAGDIFKGPITAARVPKKRLPKPGATLPTTITVLGHTVRVVAPPALSGRNLENAYVTLGDEDGDGGQGAKVLQIPSALEERLKLEGKSGVIDEGLLRVGARLAAADYSAVANNWKETWSLVVKAEILSEGDEDKYIREAVRDHPPGTLTHALLALSFLPPNVLGSPESVGDIAKAMDVLGAGLEATLARKARKEAAGRGRGTSGAAGGGAGGGGVGAGLGTGDISALLEESTYSGYDAKSLRSAICPVTGVFIELIFEKKGAQAMHKACKAKGGNADLDGVIDVTWQTAKEIYPSLAKKDVETIIKGDCTTENAMTKLAPLSLKAEMAGFSAAMKRMMCVAEFAGLGRDYKDFGGIETALEDELTGVNEDRLETAGGHITGLAYEQAGYHIENIMRARHHGVLCVRKANELSPAIKKKAQSLATALSAWADAVSMASSAARPAHAPWTQGPGAGKGGKGGPGAGKGGKGGPPGAPAPATTGKGGRGAGGNKGIPTAVAELRATVAGTEATIKCPFVGTARGCTRTGCGFMH
jgi:hypothetical protein